LFSWIALFCKSCKKGLKPLWYLFDHCVVLSSLIYHFWLPLWYLFDHCVVYSSLIYHFWLPLWYLFDHCIVCSSLSYHFWLPLWYLFDHCIVCSSLIYHFWLPFGIFKPFLQDLQNNAIQENKMLTFTFIHQTWCCFIHSHIWLMKLYVS
jgi:hypothetical protein